MARVLLVEDSPTQARVTSHALEAAGLDVTSVEQLSEALARLGTEHFDAVLLDLMLPDSAGIETFRRVRQSARRIPIVVLSGIDDESIALAALQQGAQDYLVKGQVNNAWLVRSVRYAIERRRAELLAEARRHAPMPPAHPAIEVETTGDVTSVRFAEPKLVDYFQIEQIAAQLGRLVQDGRRNLVLDLSQVAYLANGALAMLVSLDKKLRAVQGHLRLAGIRPELYDHFTVRHLHKVFDIVGHAPAAGS